MAEVLPGWKKLVVPRMERRQKNMEVLGQIIDGPH